MLSLLIKMSFKKLLENLSGDTVVSEISFVALVNAYITGLDANSPDISTRVNPPPARINRRINMDPTLTQNCALYYAQHKTQKRGATFFRKFRAAARKRALLSHSPHATNFSGVYRHHRDNGR